MKSEEKARSFSEEKELKDVAWLAKLLQVSKSWVYQGVEAGRIPTVRIGALVRFDKKAIAAWLDAQTHGVQRGRRV